MLDGKLYGHFGSSPSNTLQNSAYANPQEGLRKLHPLAEGIDAKRRAIVLSPNRRGQPP
jgi:hypothetical protein